MDLSELLGLLCKGLITSEKLKEELMKKDAYSGEEVAKALYLIADNQKKLEERVTGLENQLKNTQMSKEKQETDLIRVEKFINLTYTPTWTASEAIQIYNKVIPIFEKAYKDKSISLPSSIYVHELADFCLNYQIKDDRILKYFDVIIDSKLNKLDLPKLYFAREKINRLLGNKESAQKDCEAKAKLLEQV